MQLTIHARTQAPLWQEWKVDSEGKKTPWEAAQVVAFEVPSQLCQQHGDDAISDLDSEYAEE